MHEAPQNKEYVWAVWALVTVEIEGVKYAILQRRTVLKPNGSPESFPGPNCLQTTVHGGLEGKNRAERETLIDGLKREVKEEAKEMIDRSPNINKPEISALERILMSNGIELGTIKKMLAVSSRRVTWAQEADDIMRATGVLKVFRETKIPKSESGKNPIRKTNVTVGFEITQRNKDVSPHLISAIQKLADDGQVVLLSAQDIPKLIKLDGKLHREHGINEEGKYGMHQDEIDAMKKALTN